MTSRSARRASRRVTPDTATRPSVSPGKNAAGERVLWALARQGLLLLQDARLPSVAELVAGGPVRGSGGGHPKGRRVFRVADWLVHTEWIHTERGAHARVLESWDHWARRNKLGATRRATLRTAAALATLERVVAGMNADCAADGRLPWQERRR